MIQPRGRMSADIYINCGMCSCGTYTGESTRERSATVMTERGWRFTMKHGWICDQCNDKKAPAYETRGTP